MKKSTHKWLYLSILLLTVVVACKKEYITADSPYRAITSFKIEQGSLQLKAAIASDSLVVYWSGYVAVPDSIAPVITVSENASVSPASGKKIAFRDGQKYTVTAQDGTQTVYTLFVRIYQDQPTLATDKTFAFNINSSWNLNGFSNLIPDTSLTRVFAINGNGREIAIPLESMGITHMITKEIAKDLLDVGTYKLKIVNNTFSITTQQAILEIFARPEITSFSPAIGSPGTEVTISGKYFGNNPTVNFNGVSAEVKSATETQIKVIVPENANNGKISIVANNRTGNSVESFTILAAENTMVSVFAGNGNYSIVNGTGKAASFDDINSLAKDAEGNIYATEASGMIRKITPQGVVSTLSLSSRLTSPRGIAVAANGDIYVAEFTQHTIKKITPQGTVSIFAGSGEEGGANGTGTAASFLRPNGLAFDNNGNLFVAETFGNRIRKITPQGVVGTVAGNGNGGSADGIGAAATLDRPTGLTIAPDGHLYFCETRGNRIRRIVLSTGEVSTIAGSDNSGFKNGIGPAAEFSAIYNIAADGQGNLYVTEEGNLKVRKMVIATKKVTTYAGSGEESFKEGSGSEAGIGYPYGILSDTNGNLHVATGNRLVKISAPQ